MLLMDDTILFASTRTAMEQKLQLVVNAATDLGMKIHLNKSKYEG